MSINRKDFMRYDASAFQLIPLHRPKAKKTYPNGTTKDVGKAPLHAKWTTKTYDSELVRGQCISEERNMGVRLTDELLVIDVDPRNGGDAGFAALCHDIGIDGDAFPRVITGSGGWHCYMTKPADVLVRDTLEAEEYNGVEFKSKGRQVVAAGSRHPNGKLYRWSKDHPPIEGELPKAPKRLLNIIKRPPRSAATGGGQYTPEQIGAALEKLDVTEFDSNDKWFTLMQACHHASGGEARQEFLDWSASDPNYASDSYMVGKRWDSLHAGRDDGVTYRTLNKILRDSGAADSQVAAQVDDDEFPDDQGDDEDLDFNTPAKPKKKKPKLSKRYAEFDEEPEDDATDYGDEGMPEEALRYLDKLNKDYWALMDVGRFRIMYKQRDTAMNRDAWHSCDRKSFESLYANQRIQRDTTQLARNVAPTMPLGEAWIQWPRRRTVKGVVFEPDSDIGDGDDYLNLWSGWGMTADTTGKGSWKYMRELIAESLADGRKDIDSYIMNWLALMFQRPSEVPGVALVFRGEQGVGKGTLGNALIKIIGQHALQVSDPKHLTGQFNAHLRNTIFLFADEATSPYDRASEGKLRSLITEPTVSIERKGVDVFPTRNLLHVIMSSNEQWVIPAQADERRYMVNHVNPRWKGKSDKWSALLAELAKDGNLGYRAMLGDLLMHEIPEGFNVRDFPQTKALVEQKIFSLRPIKRFFHNALDERKLDFLHPVEAKWSDGPVTFFMSEFREMLAAWCRAQGISAGSAGRSSLTLLNAELREMFPSAQVNVRLPVPADGSITADGEGVALACVLPDIYTAAAEFEKSSGLPEGSLGIRMEFN